MDANTPIIQDTTLAYQQDEQLMQILVDTTDWFCWLSNASTFVFHGEQGSLTARKERAGNKRGGEYWKAYRRHNGKLHRAYLGKSEELTLARLKEAAARLAAQGDSLDAALVQGTAPLQSRGEPQDGQQSILQTAVPVAIEPETKRELLLSTKFHRPRPRNQLVSRSHLIERLQQGTECALTLVSAPAGFGKSTILAQWYAESGMSIAWLSLEPEDNEPIRFFSYILAALQTVHPQ